MAGLVAVVQTVAAEVRVATWENLALGFTGIVLPVLLLWILRSVLDGKMSMVKIETAIFDPNDGMKARLHALAERVDDQNTELQQLVGQLNLVQHELQAKRERHRDSD